MSASNDNPELFTNTWRTRWDSHTSFLLFALVISGAAHVLALSALPAIHYQPQTSLPRTLDVVLVRPAIVLPVVENSAPAEDPPKSTSPKVRAVAPDTRTRKTSKSALEPKNRERPTLAMPRELPVIPPTLPTAPDIPAPMSQTEARETAVGSTSAVVEQKTIPSAPAPPPPARTTTSQAPTTVSASFTASYLRNTAPPYPLVARRKGEQGTVKLKVRVTREGSATEVQLDQSSGSPSSDNAALDAVKKWRFVPARRGDEPIDSWVFVPITFRLNDAS